MSKAAEKIMYFVRHGQSEGNVSPVFQSTDSPLNESGLAQAEKVADRISKLSFDTLIASPLTRAKETATAIANKTGKEPEYSDLFVERVKPTQIIGKSYEDESANALWETWEKSLHTPGLRAEDGENFDDLVARADKALAFLAARDEASLVVVTHGYFLRTIVARVLLGSTLTGGAFQNFQARIAMENTGITVLKYTDGWDGMAWRLWIYNDHAHLGD
ncbi:MAG TPA: histidine phosphatase family protein [Candidatus Paceibacterota bacterium]|nr:histidine phosphatase family protein [Candidatus Paceibacterota bacterium]